MENDRNSQWIDKDTVWMLQLIDDWLFCSNNLKVIFQFDVVNITNIVWSNMRNRFRSFIRLFRQFLFDFWALRG